MSAKNKTRQLRGRLNKWPIHHRVVVLPYYPQKQPQLYQNSARRESKLRSSRCFPPNLATFFRKNGVFFPCVKAEGPISTFEFVFISDSSEIVYAKYSIEKGKGWSLGKSLEKDMSLCISALLSISRGKWDIESEIGLLCLYNDVLAMEDV